VAEVVLGVVRLEEASVGVVGVDVERLVGGDDDPGVLLGVRAGGGGDVGPEDVLEGAESLPAELLAIAQEQGALELASVRDPLQEVDGDERLAGAGREGEEGTLLTPGEFLQDGPDRGVLVVATARLALGLPGDEGPRGSVGQPDADGVLVAGLELLRGGEVLDR